MRNKSRVLGLLNILPEAARPTRRRVLCGLIAAGALLGGGGLAGAWAQADAAPQQAKAFMDGVSNEVIAILRNSANDAPARKSKLAAVFTRAFDVPQMARFAIGRSWDAATPAERERYVPLFERYVVGLYADKFSTYSGETVEVLAARPAAGGQQVVATLIKRPGGAAPFNVEYRLRQGDGGFRVVDVVVEGLSLLVTKRSEFAAVLQREGLSGLMQRLERQVPG